MQVVVPMAGSGERFRKAGYRSIKPLLPVGGRPAIAWLLDNFPPSWRFVFVCRRDHLASTPLRRVLRRERPGAAIVAVEPHRLGPVRSTLLAERAIDDGLPTLVNYCDFSFEWDAQAFERFVRRTKCDGAVVCYTGFHPHNADKTMYAYCRDRAGRVLEVREKACFTEDRTREYASSGTYYFRTGALMKELFRETERRGLSHGGEFYVSLAYNPLIERGGDVRVYEIPTFLQWGSPEGYEDYLYWLGAFHSWKAAAAGRLARPSRRARLIMPMAGRGARFAREGLGPKPFVQVLGQPMFRAAAKLLPAAARAPVLIVRAKHASRARAAMPQAALARVARVRPGPARSILAAEGLLEPEEPVLVSACDHGLIVDGRAWDRLLAEGPDLVVVGVRGYPDARRRPDSYAFIDAGARGLIRRVSVKRPLSGRPGRDVMLTGTFWFRRAADLFRLAREVTETVGGERYLDSAVNVALAEGLDARCFEAAAYLGWGHPDALREFEYWRRHFRRERG